MVEGKEAAGEGTEQKVERSFGLERIVFFSDAVFAIAITLLAIELKVPQIDQGADYTAEALWRAVAGEWPQFLAFFLSFSIIAAYWLSHHRYFRYIVRYDGGLIFYNLAILFFVALMPYSSELLGEYGNLSTAIILYSLNLCILGLSTAGLWYHVTSHHLVTDTLDSTTIRRFQVRSFVTPITALFVIVLALLVGAYAIFGLFLIFVIQRFIDLRAKPKS